MREEYCKVFLLHMLNIIQYLVHGIETYWGAPDNDDWTAQAQVLQGPTVHSEVGVHGGKCLAT